VETIKRRGGLAPRQVVSGFASDVLVYGFFNRKKSIGHLGGMDKLYW
jgi:hypothetical protein